MDFFSLFLDTIVLRPYVFIFLTAFLFSAARLIGWRRTWCFMGITWLVALVCEFSSTRTGIPFGWYHYTGSTVGRELYVFDIPFMDSLSFPFLLYASYCMALAFVLPATPNVRGRLGIIRMRFPLAVRTGWPAALLTILFFSFVDMIIDPVALRGERWFLGQIYYYPDPGTHFGVPIANYIGWAVVGFLSLRAYFPLDRKLLQTKSLPPFPDVTGNILLGCGLYYGVLIFNLAVTFWIGESLLGMTGLLIYLPLTVLLALRLLGRLPAEVE
jgi:uncharacterized membrane protein